MTMKTPPEAAYQLPAKPTNVGGYQWSTLLMGLVLLLVTNMMATQWIAHRFSYSRGLGQPLFSFQTARIYRPWCWALWLMHYSPSSNLYVKNTVLAGAGLVVMGSAVTIMLVLITNLRRSRQSLKGNEHLRGSGRWATFEEIEQQDLLTATEGVYVGGVEHNKRLHYLLDNSNTHCLAFAPTRSGKGVGLIIPSLLAWPDSLICYDIKGENWAKTAGFRKKGLGQHCLKFSPLEHDGSCFNPLAEIRIGTEREVSDTENLSEILINTKGQGENQNQHFLDEAASLTTAMILHLLYKAKREGRPTPNLSDLLEAYGDPARSFRETLTLMTQYVHRHPAEGKPWQTMNGPTDTHPVVAQRARLMLNKADREFSGVVASATRPLRVYSDPLVRRSVSKSDFTIRDLVDQKRGVSLYLVCPPSDYDRLEPLVRVFFTLAVTRLMEKMDFQNGAQVKNARRLLFMIDEFPTLGRMQVFAKALPLMAGYGLKAYLITQNLKALRAPEAYGVNESIVANCHHRIAYTPNEQQTADELSRETGVQTVAKANTTYSGSRSSAMAKQMSTSVEYVERPLLTPDEVKAMPGPQKIGSGNEQRIVGPGKMLILIAGCRPIYGTQMLYFLDPEMKKRTDIPPPTRFPVLTPPAAVPPVVAASPAAPQQSTHVSPPARPGETPIAITPISKSQTTNAAAGATKTVSDFELEDEEIAL